MRCGRILTAMTITSITTTTTTQKVSHAGRGIHSVRLTADKFKTANSKEKFRMSITRHIDEQKAQVTIAIEGRFDFAQHKAFRDAYRDVDPKAMTFIVDLFDASYLDSSALGMLLLLRDHAGGDEADIRLLNCSPDVRKILSVSNFEQLFVIA